MASLLNMSGGSLLKKGLPYDAEIEYLESTGTQRIKIHNVIPTDYDNIFEAKITYLGYSTYNPWIPWFYTYVDEQTNTYRIIRTQSTDNNVIVYNGTKANSGDNGIYVAIGTTYDIKMYPTYAMFNTARINISTTRGNPNTGTLCLFSMEGTKLRLYNFKYTKGDNIVLDMIPVRVGQVGYMYDKVSGQLFGNSGTDDFILGPDKTN